MRVKVYDRVWVRIRVRICVKVRVGVAWLGLVRVGVWARDSSVTILYFVCLPPASCCTNCFRHSLCSHCLYSSYLSLYHFPRLMLSFFYGRK